MKEAQLVLQARKFEVQPNSLPLFPSALLDIEKPDGRLQQCKTSSKI